MDGRDCSHDDVFVERLSRSVKLEAVYLHALESVSAAKMGIGKYFAFCNAHRSDTTLDRKTPDHVYCNSITLLRLAAAA